MHGNNQFMRIHGSEMLPIMKEQAKDLQEWCREFQDFFGWKVNLAKKRRTVVVEVTASKFNYTISADGNYLGCIRDDKKDGKSWDLTDGDFNFDTFGHIMVGILHWESPSRRRH